MMVSLQPLENFLDLIECHPAVVALATKGESATYPTSEDLFAKSGAYVAWRQGEVSAHCFHLGV